MVFLTRIFQNITVVLYLFTQCTNILTLNYTKHAQDGMWKYFYSMHSNRNNLISVMNINSCDTSIYLTLHFHFLCSVLLLSNMREVTTCPKQKLG